MNCEECTLCCELLPIKELDKPENELCKHIKNGCCSIYDKRPVACRRYECYWRENDNLPEELRPDRCHVMFEKAYYSDTWLALVDPKYPEAYKSEVINKVVTSLIQDGYSVVVSSFSNHPKFIKTPKGVLIKDVLEQLKRER